MFAVLPSPPCPTHGKAHKWMIYSTERQKYRQMSPLVNLRVSWVGSGIRENGSVLNSHPKVQGYEPLRRNLVRTWEGLDFCPRVSLSEQSPLQETRTSYCRSHAPFPTLLGSLGGLPEEMPQFVCGLSGAQLSRDSFCRPEAGAGELVVSLRLLETVLSINSGAHWLREAWVTLCFEDRVSWIGHEVNEAETPRSFTLLHPFQSLTPHFILVIFNSSSRRGTSQSCEQQAQWIWTDPSLRILKKHTHIYNEDAHKFYICTEHIHTKSCTQKNDWKDGYWDVKSSYELGTWEKKIFSFLFFFFFSFPWLGEFFSKWWKMNFIEVL